MSIREIESKARELRQWLAIIEEAQAEVEALKDEIKAAMGEAEAVQAGEYKISWKNVTSSRLDTAALKKALPEIAARFTRESTTRRFTIAREEVNMSYYVTCPFCDAHLDPGERCDCRNPPQLNESGAVLANHPVNTLGHSENRTPVLRRILCI